MNQPRFNFLFDLMLPLLLFVLVAMILRTARSPHWSTGNVRLHAPAHPSYTRSSF